ncbi:TetR/AcrR family transcriptional regulator [Nocardia asteroides NBRC 15531]|uniref:TetR family transcriptional regulator n=1 Tax=Nocardia asteroides NBRC 15531 TaxID=1110697 RepID=U5EKL5_NOCAS|nr:TetR/AcrR family transcriptional regulator [Nocardia asteroides]TLF63266.1 TetR/AcrR family transcriptional regulator [Nocardia asteroides NBRC 15531]UGT47324.1 TetR/AcrR family transcriptional regulator [Nocardia asteroides]SFM72458.1 transcriptional regulator, TetR family [Nocardia asteroides]VEG33782.1 Bacterial regulatory proteins, tetR family [Nocardia asteroides]GAD86941.1 putative TetR family transcriptional regulator [Nocardia asteroides NBRC 15531]
MNQPAADIDEQPPAPRKRTGGRSARVRQAVLAATLEQVAEHGIEGLTIGDVAARAGVAETTIYRRWKTRTALVAEAVTDLAALGNPVPDTGSLRTDLRIFTEQIAHLIARPGIARLVGTIIALSADPEVDAARQRFWTHRFDQGSLLVTRAVDRDELPASVDPREFLETLSAPLYFRLLLGRDPVDEAFITHCIDNTLTLYTHPAP